MQARQGDIFFRQVENPRGNKKLETPVLAYGEVTGHSHKIMTPALAEMESFVDENGDIYMMSPNQQIVIGHDEHNNITLPAGQWFCVTRQREYDPLAENRQRQVRD